MWAAALGPTHILVEPVIIAKSPTTWMALLIGSLLFVVAGALILATGTTTATRVVGLTNVVFFGGCALIYLSQLRDQRPRIEITEQGIEDRSLKFGVIEWADIRGVALRRQQGATFIGLDLRNADKYTSRLSPLLRRMVALNASLGFPPLSLDLTGTAADPEHVEQLLQAELAVRARDTAV